LKKHLILSLLVHVFNITKLEVMFNVINLKNETIF
jgi:hypothetical protein